MLKTSVIIATYNGEKFIYDQLESLRQQTIPVNEVLIFDDCSNDQTVEIVSNYIQENNLNRWSIIVNEKNKGYERNFLSGIQKSSGDILFLCDQDDIWKKDKVEVAINFFQVERNILALHTNTDIIDSTGKIIHHNTQKYKKTLEHFTEKKFLKKMNYPGMALVLQGNFARASAKKILMEKIKIPTHDWTLCALAAIEDGFYVSNIVLTYRRYHDKNVALSFNNKIEGDKTERINLLNKYKQYYELYSGLKMQSKESNIFYILVIERLNLLKNINLRSFIFVVNHIDYYPTWRAVVADILYIFGLKKIIRKIS